VVVTDIDKNPHLTRLLRLDLNACGSDTIVMNATIVQEPSVSQIYCDNYQKAGEPSEQLEVRIVQKNIDNIPQSIMSREFQNIRILDIQKNRISSLEHRLFYALKNLNLLNASKNEIQTISEGIEAC
jgi:Leucine-rich repeat (LRR) protein